YDNMSQYGYDLTKLPFVIQYNKRDLPNAAPIPELQEQLNPGWEVTDSAKQRVTPDSVNEGEFLISQVDGTWIERAPYLESIALKGAGVFETLRHAAKLILKSMN
ncbi:MAG: gliding-motility protein MglA, partial [Gemmatimonadetes bacterium]|nr:gliding-motility protein MglA [Gemmatimonadota bacterium]